MVNFGDSLRNARRPGWEDAYLDYEGLKALRNRLEDFLVNAEPDSPDLHQVYFEMRGEFANKLHSEIEKVSLFSLTRLGELANAVGVLRFMALESNGLKSPSVSTSKRFTSEEITGDDEESKLNLRSHNYEELVGEKGECGAIESCNLAEAIFTSRVLCPCSILVTIIR